MKNWFARKKEGPEETGKHERKEETVAAPAEPEEAVHAGPAGEDLLSAAEDSPPAADSPDAGEPGAAVEKRSRWSLFSGALQKTRKGMKSLFTFRRELDDALINEIEAELFHADFGPETVEGLVNGPEGVRAAWKAGRIERPEEVRDFLKTRLKEVLMRRDSAMLVPLEPPCVILVAGVNGTGKTTSIAKLAKRFQDEGGKVILAAADTFRAAAVEQLTVWSERLGVEIVKGAPQADPASVAYKAAEAAIDRKADFLIVDTAGRLHTQKNLMKELGKIRGVLAKKIPGSPHESLLVLDATTGQNAINQATIFSREVQMSGIILAKLDGTAKGGIVVTINHTLDIPVKFIGTGETLDDLAPFDVDRFVDALLEP